MQLTFLAVVSETRTPTGHDQKPRKALGTWFLGLQVERYIYPHVTHVTKNTCSRDRSCRSFGEPSLSLTHSGGINSPGQNGSPNPSVWECPHRIHKATCVGRAGPTPKSNTIKHQNIKLGAIGRCWEQRASLRRGQGRYERGSWPPYYQELRTLLVLFLFFAGPASLRDQTGPNPLFETFVSGSIRRSGPASFPTGGPGSLRESAKRAVGSKRRGGARKRAKKGLRDTESGS